MGNKENFGSFTPEPGSKDAETAHIEGLEAMERDFNPGTRDYEQTEEQDIVEMEKLEKERTDIYINRARLAGDNRSDEELAQEWKKLEKGKDEYRVQKMMADPTYNGIDDAYIEYMKKESPLYAAYMKRMEDVKIEESHYKTRDEILYEAWISGKDLEEK
ncbi:MAG: hypothetical protein UR69_C0002G0239 [Candidatus Moranbacteria bacterium GW2011_GWE2_35_2-]|nr:MAG: hypothetical protein UR69_C0002G0239 [Candidatus Moranbacteria bacterium GW2011_GWE2_35_2-]KKQ04220.1 MAG: hypothetical protein US15_C0064G0006 [Candidatus Moranbacteria bacterium GW2011_GWF1_36_4]KKQ22414.1 MAG: hypothetical protein US37_C0002G0039 [Candidatus Moranbacteria bacterium GW2011_GWF2_37_11]KKQ29482.1 MAG: hypothetical protein US44_C0001G0074 [Candidatus Moranbacteria bacterium GW2011_GWD1_37_17]KKQ30649.1 MAG: hypothetical protein US47_C0002G0239 [Candidatus Moranbacteria b